MNELLESARHGVSDYLANALAAGHLDQQLHDLAMDNVIHNLSHEVAGLTEHIHVVCTRAVEFQHRVFGMMMGASLVHSKARTDLKNRRHA